MAQYVSPEHYVAKVKEFVHWMTIVYGTKPRKFHDCWSGADNPEFEAAWTAREIAGIKRMQEPWLKWAAEHLTWLAEVEIAL